MEATIQQEANFVKEIGKQKWNCWFKGFISCLAIVDLILGLAVVFSLIFIR